MHASQQQRVLQDGPHSPGRQEQQLQVCRHRGCVEQMILHSHLN
mgnify:CR=1 FL=1